MRLVLSTLVVFVALAVLPVPADSHPLDLPLSILPRSPKGGGAAGGRGGGGGRSSGGRGRSGGSRGSGLGRGGSGDTGRPPIVVYSGGTTTSSGGSGDSGRSANYFGGGGGKPFTLSESSPFKGRLMGGGTRGEIFGTRTFGSGYPYTNSASDINVRSGGGGNLQGQPFPFGFWPIYWAGHGNSDEYGANSTLASERPGGKLAKIELVPLPNSGWNASTALNTTNPAHINETYWIIGDNESVSTIRDILADSKSPYYCRTFNLTVEPFNSSDTSERRFGFGNVIQWYRASSFALAYGGYNNSYTYPPLNESTTFGVGWDTSSPLADEQTYSPFLRCINNTIAAALPILDGPAKKMSAVEIFGAVLGSVVGAILLCLCCHCWCTGQCSGDDERIERRRRERRYKKQVKEATKRVEEEKKKRAQKDKDLKELREKADKNAETAKKDATRKPWFSFFRQDTPATVAPFIGPLPKPAPPSPRFPEPAYSSVGPRSPNSPNYPSYPSSPRVSLSPTSEMIYSIPRYSPSNSNELSVFLDPHFANFIDQRRSSAPTLSHSSQDQRRSFYSDKTAVASLNEGYGKDVGKGDRKSWA